MITEEEAAKIAKAAIAAEYRRTHALRSQGRADKAAAGGYATGSPPFGWKAQSGELIPVPGEQQVIRMILSMRDQGLSLRMIVEELKEKGFYPKRGGKWHPTTIQRVIDGPAPVDDLSYEIVEAVHRHDRFVISSRTKEALEIARASGVVLGRPRTLPDEVRDKIKIMRSEGKTFREIAWLLNNWGVPTAQGGKVWYASTVRKVCNT